MEKFEPKSIRSIAICSKGDSVLEQLIKDRTVIPASKLAEAKDLELQRSREFEVSIEDEQRHRKTATTAPEDKPKNLPLTRERFEE